MKKILSVLIVFIMAIAGVRAQATDTAGAKKFTPAETGEVNEANRLRNTLEKEQLTLSLKSAVADSASVKAPTKKRTCLRKRTR